MISMQLGLPTQEEEIEILRRAEQGTRKVKPLLSQGEIIEMQETAANVQLAGSVREYIANLATATRQSEDISVGVSPRGPQCCKGPAKPGRRSTVAPLLSPRTSRTWPPMFGLTASLWALTRTRRQAARP